jgi:transmembrane sensor
VAVAVLLGAVGTILVTRLIDQPPQVERPPERTVETAAGERATLRLVDGTQVRLNAESRLSVPQDFGPTSRSVQLQGEAFFEVGHDPDRPFTVHAAGATVLVVGTQFGIRAYHGEGGVHVAVTEGEVAMWSSQAVAPDTLRLRRNHVARMADTTVAYSPSSSAAVLTAWAQGRLVFDAAPLPEVARTLERWFGIRIRLADPAISDRRFTAQFTTESLETILSTIAVAMDVQYERHDDEVVLR